MNSIRKEDVRRSDLVSNFLDDYFYPITKNFERVYNLQEQYQGIDVKFEFNNFNYTVDEKAATDWVNKCLKTFALELSSIDRGGNVHVGWLLDSSKTNNSYLFAWVDRAINEKISCKEDIKQLEMILIKKEKILSYLSSIGWTIDNLNEKAFNIRYNNDNDFLNFFNNGCEFRYSLKKREKPINILIERKVLRNLSDYKIVWTIN